MCEFSQLLPGVMQDLTPVPQVHEVIILNKYFAGNFALINAHRPLWLFLSKNSNTTAELPESCKFTGISLNLPGQSRAPSDTSNRNCVGSICTDPHVPKGANHPESALAISPGCVTALLYFYFQLMDLSQCLRTLESFCRNFHMERRDRKGQHFHRDNLQALWFSWCF